MDDLNAAASAAGGHRQLSSSKSSSHASAIALATPTLHTMASDVTVTVGGPMLHPSPSAASFSSSSYGSHDDEINIVATASAFHSSESSFEETKELLARHLHHRGFEAANFDGIDLGPGEDDDQANVPLGDILEKLQAEAADLDEANSSSATNVTIGDLIRLHSDHHPTISATVNVATLDLSDPDSIHQHLSQLNDTVLRVTACSSTNSKEDIMGEDTNHAAATEDFFDNSSESRDDVVEKPTIVAEPEQQPPMSPKKATPLSSPATPRKAGSSKASPQSCSVCSKVFSNASALAKHRLTHSEERRYHCNICGKAFKRQDHLNGHLLTHRSTKPFACHVEGCGKSYCDARSLRRHKENHHGLAKVENAGKSSSTVENEAAKALIGAPPDHLISKSSGVLGDTKIKFSTKGLTAQQLQLIEQLFKQSKSKVDNSKAGDETLSQQQPLTATTAKKGTSDKGAGLPDKPVECTICCRKFKNIPALNGHMRLHGGYYKKDAEGRRLMANGAAIPLKAIVKSSSKPGVVDHQATKRKLQQATSSSSLCESEPSGAAAKKPTTISVTYCQPNNAVVQVTPSFAFSNLPQPDTSKLLANLEQKTKQLSSSSTTTSSLRALRKPTNGTTTSNVCSSSKKDNNPHNQIASLINTQPLALPLVALPTKPLPVVHQQMAPPADLEDSKPSPTSIQITALIQSNSCMTSGNSLNSMSGGGHSDFVVQASTTAMQECGLLNSIPLVNSMLTCLQQQQQAVNLHQKPSSHMLRVDQGSDHSPKIGPAHQADIPDLLLDYHQNEPRDEEQQPVWHPSTASCLSDSEFNQYLCVASSCAVRGGSHNEEVALEILQKHSGNVQFALQDLLSAYDFEDEDSMSLFSSHDSDFEDEDHLQTRLVANNRPWQPFEVDLFYEGLVRYHKDFNRVARHVGSKSVKDVVEFYYLWKNICYEESQSFKSLYNSADVQQQQQQQISSDCSNGSSAASREQICSSNPISAATQSSSEMAGPSSVSSVV